MNVTTSFPSCSILLVVNNIKFNFGIYIGRRFSIDFDVLDQWGNRFIDTLPNPECVFFASINSNNPQSAVLWGVRSNSSFNGMLQFSSLAISQPGNVEFKVSFIHYKSDSERSISEKTVLQVFQVNVREDEKAVSLSPCMYVFKQAFCPIDSIEANWIAGFYTLYFQILLLRKKLF